MTTTASARTAVVPSPARTSPHAAVHPGADPDAAPVLGRSARHVGPQWFPAAMGTGILATCTEQLASVVPALHAAALGMLLLAWAALVVVGAAFIGHALRRPDRFRASFSDLAVFPFYGTLAMGLVAVGSATLAVAGRHAPEPATAAAWALWTTGTLLGVLTALVHPVRLLTAAPAVRGRPTFLWGLPVVPPMVSAAGGAALAGTLPFRGAAALLLVCAALFVLALVLGAVVFGLAYAHFLRGSELPLQGSPAVWIPLGVAGQSTAAANFLFAAADGVVPPGTLTALHGPVALHGALALGLGAAAGVLALRVTVRALRRGMVFGPGWWSFTFPVGTMSLGAFAHGTTFGIPWLIGVSAVVCACLAGTVALCLTGSVRCCLRHLDRGGRAPSGSAVGVRVCFGGPAQP